MNPKILDRLTQQLQARGMKHNQAFATATEQLQKHGILHPGTTALTQKGEVRNAMSPAQRAIDRAAKYSGGKHQRRDYVYNPTTNQATLKRR